METIAKISGIILSKKFKEISRDLNICKNTVHKVIRGGQKQAWVYAGKATQYKTRVDLRIYNKWMIYFFLVGNYGIISRIHAYQ